MGSSTFAQIAPTRSPAGMLSSSMILSNIRSRCPHWFNSDDVATSFLTTGK